MNRMVAGLKLAPMAPLSKVFTSLTQVMTASDLHIQMAVSRLSSSMVFQMFALPQAPTLTVIVDLKRRRRKRRNDNELLHTNTK